MVSVYFLKPLFYETELDLYELTCLCPTVFQPVETAVVPPNGNMLAPITEEETASEKFEKLSLNSNEKTTTPLSNRKQDLSNQSSNQSSKHSHKPGYRISHAYMNQLPNSDRNSDTGTPISAQFQHEQDTLTTNTPRNSDGSVRYNMMMENSNPPDNNDFLNKTLNHTFDSTPTSSTTKLSKEMLENLGRGVSINRGESFKSVGKTSTLGPNDSASNIDCLVKSLEYREVSEK